MQVNRIYPIWYDEVEIQDALILDCDYTDTMVYVQKLTVALDLSQMLKGNVMLDKVRLQDGQFNLRFHEGKDTLNFNQFLAAFQNPNKKKKKRNAVKIEVKKLMADNMVFSFWDNRADFVGEGFDGKHFAMDSIHLNAESFLIKGDTIAATILALEANERYTLVRLRDLSSAFQYTSTSLSFAQLTARVNNSKISDSIVLHYRAPATLSYFIDSVNIEARLRNTRINSSDLAHFIPAFRKYHDTWFVNADINGTIDSLRITDLDARFGKKSSVSGSIALDGLPDADVLFIMANLPRFELLPTDLAPYTGQKATQYLQPLSVIKGNAHFTGFTDNFVIESNLFSGGGSLATDISVRKLNSARPEYSGKLKANEFHLGPLIPNAELGKASFNAEISASGNALANLQLDGKIDASYLEWKGYRYTNLNVKGQMAQRTFTGELLMNDPNLQGQLNGEINFEGERHHASGKLNLPHADLDALGLSLTDKKPILSTTALFDFEFDQPDDIVAHLALDDTYIRYGDAHELRFSKLSAETYLKNTKRVLNASSDYFELNTEGEYAFGDLLYEAQKSWSDVSDAYSVTKEISLKEKTAYKKSTSIEVKLNLIDINPILEIYAAKAYIAPNTKIDAKLSSDSIRKVSLEILSDESYYGQNRMDSIDLSFNFSQHLQTDFWESQGSLHSTYQEIEGILPTQNLIFEYQGDEKSNAFAQSIDLISNKGHIETNGIVKSNAEGIEISFKESNIALPKHQYHISPDGNLFFSYAGGLIFNDFTLLNEEQILALDGGLNESETAQLNIHSENLNLELLTFIFSDVHLYGKLNTDATIKKGLSAPAVEGTFNLTDFQLDTMAIGDIEGVMEYLALDSIIRIEASVSRANLPAFQVNGNIYVTAEKRIDLHAKLTGLDLGLINPFVAGAIDHIKGEALGRLRITGTVFSPIVKGSFVVRNGSFRIPYLNTTYTFNDPIVFDENLIGFKNLRLVDPYGKKATLNGGVYHDGFKDFILSLKGDMTEPFLVMNTTKKDNEQFYGFVVATGKLNISGSPDSLTIRCLARSEKNTRVSIPISSATDYEDLPFLRFISGDTANLEEEINKTDLSGINLQLGLEITPEAEIAIIFNEQTGDILKSRGRGNMKMEIDTRGDFKLYGDYTIESGTYNFTLANVINKEFILDKGSRINWSGNPYEGLMNVNARYRQMVPLSPIITDSSLAKSNEARKRNPVSVLMNMSGPLMQPTIGLDVEIERKYAGSLSGYVAAFESNIKNNENEMNKQVFSLIVLKSLASQDALNLSGSGANISEMFSNQLSSWLSQVDENLEIYIDLNSLDPSNLNGSTMRFSYTMLEGRLRVSREGAIAGTGNNTSTTQTNNNSLSAVAGEWTVEYLLTQDGALRLKFYNRISQNSIVSTNNASYNTAGFSVIHSVNFNKIGELFHQGRRKRKKASVIDVPDDSDMELEQQQEEEQKNQEEQERKDEQPTQEDPLQ